MGARVELGTDCNLEQIILEKEEMASWKANLEHREIFLSHTPSLAAIAGIIGTGPTDFDLTNAEVEGCAKILDDYPDAGTFNAKLVPDKKSPRSGAAWETFAKSVRAGLTRLAKSRMDGLHDDGAFKLFLVCGQHITADLTNKESLVDFSGKDELFLLTFDEIKSCEDKIAHAVETVTIAYHGTWQTQEFSNKDISLKVPYLLQLSTFAQVLKRLLHLCTDDINLDDGVRVLRDTSVTRIRTACERLKSLEGYNGKDAANVHLNLKSGQALIATAKEAFVKKGSLAFMPIVERANVAVDAIGFDTPGPESETGEDLYSLSKTQPAKDLFVVFQEYKSEKLAWCSAFVEAEIKPDVCESWCIQNEKPSVACRLEATQMAFACLQSVFGKCKSGDLEQRQKDQAKRLTKSNLLLPTRVRTALEVANFPFHAAEGEEEVEEDPQNEADEKLEVAPAAKKDDNEAEATE